MEVNVRLDEVMLFALPSNMSQSQLVKMRGEIKSLFFVGRDLLAFF